MAHARIKQKEKPRRASACLGTLASNVKAFTTFYTRAIVAAYAQLARRQRFQINLPRFLSIRLDSSLDPRAARERERENFRPNIHVTYVNEERCRYVYPRTRRHK